MKEVKIRLIPAMGLYFCIQIFFIWLSANFYTSNSLGYGILGGILTSFCLFFSVKGIQDTEDFTNSIPEKLRFGTAPTFSLAVIAFISFIIFTSLLTSMYSNIKENELKQFGKITTGEVTEGFSQTGRNVISTFKVTVEYSLKGETIRAFTTVTPSEYQNCYIGKEVKLIYSTKNPNLIDIIGDDAKVETYVKIKNRTILISDLLKIMDLNNDLTEAYLNSISYPWNYDLDKKGWSNNEKNLYLIKPSEESVSYLTTTFNPEELNDEIDKLKFEKLDTISNSNKSPGEKIKLRMLSAVGLYRNNKYALMIKSTFIGTSGQIAMVIQLEKIKE
ncbi:hypothetical protein [Flavobacterium sp.]|jgi:hypothetical protein|uniref:hypothetical protein n=1 Tax=Flavobacterium sp. TaxID=239 RepID=UPI0037C01FA4